MLCSRWQPVSAVFPAHVPVEAGRAAKVVTAVDGQVDARDPRRLRTREEANGSSDVFRSSQLPDWHVVEVLVAKLGVGRHLAGEVARHQSRQDRIHADSPRAQLIGAESVFGATDDRHGGAIGSKPLGTRRAETTAAPSHPVTSTLHPFEPAFHRPIVAYCRRLRPEAQRRRAINATTCGDSRRSGSSTTWLFQHRSCSGYPANGFRGLWKARCGMRCRVCDRRWTNADGFGGDEQRLSDVSVRQWLGGQAGDPQFAGGKGLHAGGPWAAGRTSASTLRCSPALSVLAMW